MRTTEQAALVRYEQVATNLLLSELNHIDLYDLANVHIDDQDSALDDDVQELVYTLRVLVTQISTVLVRGALHTSYEPLYGPLPPVVRDRELNSEDLSRGFQFEGSYLGDYIPEEG